MSKGVKGFHGLTRHELMSKIRSSGNKKTELAFVAFLRSQKITGWRRRFAALGKPDVVFPSVRVAVFLDGCFWHGCPRHGRIPEVNQAFWARKIATNRCRDKKVSRLLRAKGWRVLRVWEHDLTRRRHEALLRRLSRALGEGA